MVDRKIISLAPTHTETLYFLGVKDKVIGVTENCDYPEEAKSKKTFGTWAYPNIPEILEVAPDLVCTFSSHQLEFARFLEEHGIRVFHSNPPDVKTAIGDIEKLGRLVEAIDLEAKVKSLVKRLEKIAEVTSSLDFRPSVFRIMNWNPLVTVGSGAFQDDVIRLAGGRNIFRSVTKPYFTVSLREVKKKDPEIIFFCEQDLKEKIRKSVSWKSIRAVRKNKIYCFPCGLTCRSGPRIVDMVEELAKVLHPGLFV